jgi:nitroreductase
MDAIEAILTRRSIRKYQDKPVPKDVIHKLLEAGMAAPSSMNLQPWRFIIIDGRAILDKMTELHPHAKMLKEAPIALLVCADTKIQKMEGYCAQDCSAATENILLAAHALGLGAVWLGVYPRKERMDAIAKLFGLPDEIIPISLISIGYPAEEKPASNRFDPTFVHHNKWGTTY